MVDEYDEDHNIGSDDNNDVLDLTGGSVGSDEDGLSVTDLDEIPEELPAINDQGNDQNMTFLEMADLTKDDVPIPDAHRPSHIARGLGHCVTCHSENGNYFVFSSATAKTNHDGLVHNLRKRKSTATLKPSTSKGRVTGKQAVCTWKVDGVECGLQFESVHFLNKHKEAMNPKHKKCYRNKGKTTKCAVAAKMAAAKKAVASLAASTRQAATITCSSNLPSAAPSVPAPAGSSVTLIPAVSSVLPSAATSPPASAAPSITIPPAVSPALPSAAPSPPAPAVSSAVSTADVLVCNRPLPSKTALTSISVEKNWPNSYVLDSAKIQVPCNIINMANSYDLELKGSLNNGSCCWISTALCIGNCGPKEALQVIINAYKENTSMLASWRNAFTKNQPELHQNEHRLLRRRIAHLSKIVHDAGGTLARGTFPESSWGCIPSDMKALAVGTGAKVHVFDITKQLTCPIFGERLSVSVFSPLCDGSQFDTYYLDKDGHNPHFHEYVERRGNGRPSDILLVFDGVNHFNALIPKTSA